MNENVKVDFGLIGGLALFLYGMNSMSDALQKAAGERMKKILGFLTRNPIMGALAGALVTAVLQSSSATTVMVIGFVRAHRASFRRYPLQSPFPLRPADSKATIFRHSAFQE